MDVATPISIERIVDAAAEFYHVSPRDILGHTRYRTPTNARQIAMYLSRRLTNLSLEEIGYRIGVRDHTTILHAIRKVKRMVDDSPLVAQQIGLLEQRLTDEAVVEGAAA